MINPVDYLWYKLYKVFSHIEKGAASSSAKCLGGVLLISSFTILSVINKNIILNYSTLIVVLIIIIDTPYFCTKKQAKVLKNIEVNQKWLAV